jgi:hypothetical protein
MKPTDIMITVKRLDPAETEIHLSAPEPVSARLLGPRCRFASTVEVAHWFRPAPGSTGTLRAIVPEPSLWDPESPFLYDAIIRPETGPEIRRTIGLRTVSLGSSGVLVQRKPWRLSGVERRHLDDAAELRAAGVNTIVCPVTPGTLGLWDVADSWGFFMLGELSAESLSLAPQLEDHASCLGWICDPSLSPPAGIVGIRASGADVPDWARFTVGSTPTGALPWIANGASNDPASSSSIGRIR